MAPVVTPRGITLPRNVLRALLVVTEWCKESGYRVVILKDGKKR